MQLFTQQARPSGLQHSATHGLASLLGAASLRLAVPQRPAGRQRAVVARSAQGTTLPAMKKTETEREFMVAPPMENAADDASIANPLLRAERLGTGWFGAIVELEGVLVQETDSQHQQAWVRVAAEFDYPRPLGHLFRRIKGVRDEVVCTRIFNWTQNPVTAKLLSARKRSIYEELLENRQPAAMLEAKPFLKMLRRYNIPVALSCALPEERVRECLNRTGLGQSLDAVVTAEDSGAPEVEFYYSYASQQIQRPPIRCVVFGESNIAVEAAHELGMKCVIITGNKPVYDFAGADLVVRNLSQVSFLNLKRLFSEEDLVKPKSELDEQDQVPEDSEVDDCELDGGLPELPRQGAFWSGR